MLRAVELDRAVHEIVEARRRRPGTRNRTARGTRVALARGDLVGGQRGSTCGRTATPPPCALRPPRASPSARPACSSSSTRARRDEPLGHRAMPIEALGLKVRRVRSADVGPFVPVEAEPAQAVEDALDHFGRRALDVGVFDAQDERRRRAGARTAS